MGDTTHPVLTGLSKRELDAVDVWIEERRALGEDLSRSQAIRRLAAEALVTMGLLNPRETG